MYTSDLIRGHMAKKVSSEKFLIHVASAIERQLQEWDATYYVYLMKLRDYELSVKCGEGLEYSLTLKEAELKKFQKEAPYALDRYIWKSLIEQDLTVIRSSGNYMEIVFDG